MTDNTQQGPRRASARPDTATRGVTVGVDMGASKTRLQARHAQQVIADRTLSSLNVLHAEYEPTADAIVDLVLGLLGDGRLPGAVVVGAHGCDSQAQKDELRLLLAQRLPVAWQVVNDAELLLPAAGLTSGVAVVAGTGSVATGRTAGGQVLQSGGWGWMLGDEGSAAGIVRAAGQACLDRADRGAPQDELTRRLTSAFGVTAAADLAQAMSRAAGAASWGRHAAEVFAAADDGCPAAVRVVDQAGEALADLVLKLVGRGADADAVVVAGGVILAQQRLHDAFTRALSQVLPGSRCVALEAPPVAGALELAERLVAAGH